MAKPTACKTLTDVLEAEQKSPARNTAKQLDTEESSQMYDDDDDDDDNDEEDEEDDDGAKADDDDGVEEVGYNDTADTAQPVHGFGTLPPPVPLAAAHVSQPFPLTAVQEDSKLGHAAAALFETTGYSLADDLAWQAEVKGDATKIKSFRIEATQQVDLVPFAFMRPASPYVQVLHSVATYAVRGGDSDLHGKDFGFVGDRTTLRIPTPVIVDDSLWKWMTKTIGMDVPPLQEYYAKPTNARKLYFDTASGGSDTTVPRMLYLPPPFLAFCLEQQWTPFDLHEFVQRYATRPQSEVSSAVCEAFKDWCIVATQATKASAITTSILAVVLQTAPTDDDSFLRWLYKVDRTQTGGATYPPPTTTLNPPAQRGMTAAIAAPLPAPPSADVWTQMANSISSSFASAAASLKPPSVEDADTSYELGGRLYDKFQMAAVRGFAHVAEVTDLPAIWALFQYTKHLETHKDNLRRKMIAWATSVDREQQVPIDRSFFLPDATMKEILSLQFNPGGVVPEPEDADLGLSILICRARTTAAKAAIRKFEKAKEQSKRNRSMAEAEQEQLQRTAYDIGSLPDDYNELLRCVGTYCALLFALFGERCSFYKHCYALWKTMNSDLVYEQRQTTFTALFCRQIVWAILAESRVFFSTRLSVDNFAVAHADDIQYPRSQLLSIVPNVRDGTPIVRASFPLAWQVGTSGSAATITRASLGHGAATVAPVQSVTAANPASPSVVSGLTTGSTRALRAPITIRASNVHPKIKQVMEPYIQKHKAIYLTALLTHCNLTIDDLPRPSADTDGGTGICYNFILGRCPVDSCQHVHVPAADITDEFATDLLSRLRPGITEFMTNGLPAGARRRRPRRRRRE